MIKAGVGSHSTEEYKGLVYSRILFISDKLLFLDSIKIPNFYEIQKVREYYKIRSAFVLITSLGGASCSWKLLFLD